MVISFSKMAKAVCGGAATAALALTMVSVAATDVAAQTASQSGRDGGQYIPTIWVDPDGCEHWVMDDGFEGYMTPHVNRQGIPVCRRGRTCGELDSDQFFKTDSFHLSRAAKMRLREFFKTAGATSYIISGHTDSRASDEYNLRLSLNRANAVAAQAKVTGARIADVRGYGERLPKAANTTAAGRKANRRVEILCLR